MLAIEHPNVDTNRFHSYPTSPQLVFHKAQNSLDSLRDPLQVFAPVQAAQDIVKKCLNEYFTSY